MYFSILDCKKWWHFLLWHANTKKHIKNTDELRWISFDAHDKGLGNLHAIIPFWGNMRFFIFWWCHMIYEILFLANLIAPVRFRPRHHVRQIFLPFVIETLRHLLQEIFQIIIQFSSIWFPVSFRVLAMTVASAPDTVLLKDSCVAPAPRAYSAFRDSIIKVDVSVIQKSSKVILLVSGISDCYTAFAASGEYSLWHSSKSVPMIAFS